MTQKLIRLLRSRGIWLAILAFIGFWLFWGRLLMEFEWRSYDADATHIATLRQDLAAGLTGPRLKTDPCMMQQMVIDLDIRLDGPFPVGVGRDIVMEVAVISDTLLVDRLYLGPPTRRLDLKGLPVCVRGPDLPRSDKDDAAYGYVQVSFDDLDGKRFLTFQGEDSFPIFFWRSLRVDWSVIPWVMAGTESLSNVMVTPH